HEDHAVLVAIEGGIKVGHHRAHVGGGGAHHDAVGFHEVRDSGAFLEEFGVGAHFHQQVGAALVQFGLYRGQHLVGGAHGHGGLGDHNLVALHLAANFGGHAQHILQI